MQHHLLTNWPDTGYGRGGRRELSSKVPLAAREVLQLVYLLHNSSRVIFNLRRVIALDGPPADVWYSPHAQTRCLLLVTSEATNFGKVLRFQHLIRTPVRAFTVVFRRFLGRNIKRRKIKNRHFSGRKRNSVGLWYIIIYRSSRNLAQWHIMGLRTEAEV